MNDRSLRRWRPVDNTINALGKVPFIAVSVRLRAVAGTCLAVAKVILTEMLAT